MVSVTFNSHIADLGRAYGKAFHDQAKADGLLDAIGRPGAILTEPDRGSVQLGRFMAIEGDPEDHFRLLGGGDTASGMRLSAAAFIHGMGFADSFLVTDLADGNAFQSSSIQAAARAIFRSSLGLEMVRTGRGNELAGDRVELDGVEMPDDYLEAGRYLIGLVEGMNAARIEDLYSKAMLSLHKDGEGHASASPSDAFTPTRFVNAIVLKVRGMDPPWKGNNPDMLPLSLPSVDFVLDTPDTGLIPSI